MEKKLKPQNTYYWCSVEKMIADLQIALLVVAGIVGTLVSIALGWSESTEPFDIKKFISSFIRGAIAAVIYVVGAYALSTDVTAWDYIIVAIFSAGFDVLVKRGQGAVATKQAQAIPKPTP